MTRKEIFPTKKLLKQFPHYKGKKFFLLNWVGSETIKVKVEDLKAPQYWSRKFFKIK